MSFDNRPIGIFDSGVGGLTVASELRKKLPNERFIFFGDTAHLPYGDKSRELIAKYSEGIFNFLIGFDCKAVVIACNTASAYAFDFLKEINNEILVFNVIDPTVNKVVLSGHINVGIIGTKGTINSGVYESKLIAKNTKIIADSLATPLLVPVIEEGFAETEISQKVIEEYLNNFKSKNLQSIILGCTHYPIIKKEINKYFKNSVSVIDSAITTAQFVYNTLSIDNKLAVSNENADDLFFVSDYTNVFEQIAKKFFGKEIKLAEKNIW